MNESTITHHIVNFIVSFLRKKNIVEELYKNVARVLRHLSYTERFQLF